MDEDSDIFADDKVKTIFSSNLISLEAVSRLGSTSPYVSISSPLKLYFALTIPILFVTLCLLFWLEKFGLNGPFRRRSHFP